MGRSQSGRVEVESLGQFDSLVADGSVRMRGWLLQDVDLSARTDVLLRLDPTGSMLLGCELTDEADRHLRAHGALVFPEIPDLPFDPYRSALYTPEDLYAGLDEGSYEQTVDARVYGWSRAVDPRKVDVTLAQSLHDLAIDDALEEALRDRAVVGVMGGHALGRTHPSYATAVSLGRTLARAGLMVATGGGPGAMEAANLGAYLADRDEQTLDAAGTMLAPVPTFRPFLTDWAKTAMAVRRRWPDGRPSLGIPTWFYGHEPPNAFASVIAKYFRNALREDTLLHTCGSGIVFLPGAAGTVQEIFQDACENYYAVDAAVAPMVLVGVDHWTRKVPVWPLLQTLARGRPMQRHIFLVESAPEVVECLLG